MTGKRPSTAVITGASRGVGQAIAVAFADEGSRLALVGRDEARLADTAAQVRAAGAEARCFVADLSSRPDVDRLARDLNDTYDAISVLVHSAGVFVTGDIQSSPIDDFDRALDVNLRAPYLLTRDVFPALVAGSGYVVFINSSVVGQRRAGVAAYGASKRGLTGVADSLRQEANQNGIRVLTVYLGATATPMQRDIYAREGRPYHPESLLQPADVAYVIRCAVALPPGAEVTDLHIRPSLPHRAGDA